MICGYLANNMGCSQNYRPLPDIEYITAPRLGKGLGGLVLGFRAWELLKLRTYVPQIKL